MGLFNSSNPALNENTLREVTAVYGTEAMTLNGTIWKTVLGVALTFAGGLYAVYATLQNPASMQALLWVGLIGGLIAAMVTIFKPTVARFTMPIYAVLEGLVLGALRWPSRCISARRWPSWDKPSWPPSLRSSSCSSSTAAA